MKLYKKLYKVKKSPKKPKLNIRYFYKRNNLLLKPKWIWHKPDRYTKPAAMTRALIVYQNLDICYSIAEYLITKNKWRLQNEQEISCEDILLYTIIPEAPAEWLFGSKLRAHIIDAESGQEYIRHSPRGWYYGSAPEGHNIIIAFVTTPNSMYGYQCLERSDNNDWVSIVDGSLVSEKDIVCWLDFQPAPTDLLNQCMSVVSKYYEDKSH